jgi:hypothetical protein
VNDQTVIGLSPKEVIGVDFFFQLTRANDTTVVE